MHGLHFWLVWEGLKARNLPGHAPAPLLPSSLPLHPSYLLGCRPQWLQSAGLQSGSTFPTGLRCCLAPSSGREGEGAAGGRQAGAHHRGSGACLRLPFSRPASASPFHLPNCSPPFFLCSSLFPFRLPTSPQPHLPPSPSPMSWFPSFPGAGPSGTELSSLPRTWPTSHPGSLTGECYQTKTSVSWLRHFWCPDGPRRGLSYSHSREMSSADIQPHKMVTVRSMS